jgi:hypothetical protein
MNCGELFFTVLLSAKKRVIKPIKNEEISDEIYRIMPLWYEENIKTPTADITKAGDGLAHQQNNRRASFSDMRFWEYKS